jgi:APA family basic amino acid/polyamine antiporter
MSRDGLLPPFFAEIHPKTKTPVRVIALCGLLISLIAGFIPLGELAELVNIGTLAAFVLVCLGVVVLRIRQPHLHRPFKNPLNPVFPLFGAFSCAALMAFLPWVTWLRFAAWLAIGVIFYFTYSIRHSKLGNQEG